MYFSIDFAKTQVICIWPTKNILSVWSFS
jgi:hypothetical protein